MPNHSIMAGTPPAPNPQPNDNPPGSQAGGPMAIPPAPTHQQVVAGIRHFHALERQLVPLLRNPDCGRADLKSAAVDAMSDLVSDGIFPAGQAVSILATFPDRPFQQRQWLEQHLESSIVAPQVLLEHHRAAFGGQPHDNSMPSPDDHSAYVSSLAGKYQNG